nr:MAG TPA: hypothetical protein [Caudoviricetes sp.]DAZ47110.1 MAG TPA: hypothetical protein [Caudoviricetes sp.]
MVHCFYRLVKERQAVTASESSCPIKIQSTAYGVALLFLLSLHCPIKIQSL